MARLIPSRNACLPRMTGGEKRLSERMEKKLEDDYLLWYDVPVGPKQLHPDFIVLHPRRGILILEVKDWKLDTIHHVDRNTFTLRTERGLVVEKNPQMQARVYALEVVNILQADPALRQSAGTAHAGKLCMPYGWGTVLTNITRHQFETAQLDQVLEPSRVICQDEMLEAVDAEAFQKRLWEMFHQVFPCAVTLPQIDRARHHLFPEIRVAAGVNQFGLFPEGNSDKSLKPTIPDLIRVMDLNQELIARSLGEGHRVIHGVAGSGKTMILGYRCVSLANALTKPILVLCYNVSLAGRLRQLMEANGISDRVRVRSFHAWCSEILTTYNVTVPDGPGRLFERQVMATINAVDHDLIPRAQYGAVMIDEGHDFEPDWFKLVVQMVDPVSNAMLVLYDDAQAIYGTRRKKFSFASVGIQAAGRTTILKLNYRNTLEVLTVARAFANELLSAEEADDDGVPLVSPESAGRRGRIPEMIEHPSLDAEAKMVAHRILDELGSGRNPSEIGVLYRTGDVADAVERHLDRLQIPSRSGTSSKGRKTLFEGEPAVKLVSLHSSKGLEFQTVFIPAAGQPMTKDFDEAEEAKLLYVGMTRSTDQLVMSCHRSAPLNGRLRDAVQATAAVLAS